MAIGSNILATAVSGLLLQGQRAGTIANNVVNVGTPGFRPSDLRTVGTAPGGVRAQAVVDGDGVDLGREFTRLIETEIAYTANARVIRAGDELLRATVDILA